jgi:hypothetical protein
MLLRIKFTVHTFNGYTPLDDIKPDQDYYAMHLKFRSQISSAN